MGVLFFIYLVACTFAIAQNCIYEAKNANNTALNLTALNGTIITFTGGVFDFSYTLCYNISAFTMVDGGTYSGGLWFPTIANEKSSHWRFTTQFIDSLDSAYQGFKIVFSYDYVYNGYHLEEISAIVYWLCDSQTHLYKVLDSGTTGHFCTTYPCATQYPQVQLRILSQYACNFNEFNLKSFLEELGLKEYYQLFINERFKNDDYRLISKLTDKDLEKLGINKMADRYRILSHFDSL
eukprot:499205_1